MFHDKQTSFLLALKRYVQPSCDTPYRTKAKEDQLWFDFHQKYGKPVLFWCALFEDEKTEKENEETEDTECADGVELSQVHHLHGDGAAQQGLRLGAGVCVGRGRVRVRRARVQHDRQGVQELQREEAVQARTGRRGRLRWRHARRPLDQQVRVDVVC